MKRLQFANSVGSPRAMSIVLYALGAGLFAWSAYLLAAGDSYAAMDIAASLAGWGAFAIGLGAVVAAIGRLTGAITGRGARPIASELESDFADDATGEIVPVFIARGGEPGHFEPSPGEQEPVEPLTTTDAPAPEPDTQESALRPPRFEPRIEARRMPVEPAARAPEPDAKAPMFEPETRVAEAQPEPAAVEPEPAVEPPAEPIAESEDDPSVPKQTEPTREERRAMRLKARQARQAEAAEKSRTAVEAAVPPGEEAGNGIEADDDRRQVETVAAEAPAPRPRPIMPRRQDWDFDLRGSLDKQDDGPDESPGQPEAAAPEPAPQPKVPEWLARARERRAARIQTGEGEPAVIAADAPPVFVAAPEPAVEPEPAAEPDSAIEPEPEAAAEPEIQAAASEEAVTPEEEEEPTPGPRIVREGEHNGVQYRFYDDGSVEAATAHGVRRFASIDELRETVLAARGTADEDAGASEPEPKVPAPHDPLDEALAELEGRSAPEPRIDPDDRQRPRR